MGKNEDYLDSLLNSVTKKLSEFDEDFEQKKETADAYMTKKNLPPRTMKALETVRENQFLRDFENELKQEDVDGFLKEFEAELEDEALEYERTHAAQGTDGDASYMDQVDQLVSESEAEPQVDDDELMVDTFPDLGDFVDLPDEPETEPKGSGEETSADDLNLSDMGLNLEDMGLNLSDIDDTATADVGLPEGMEDLESLFEDEGTMPLSGLSDLGVDNSENEILPEDEALDDEGIMDLLNSMSEDEALSDIGKMLEADEQTISLDDLSAEPENLSHAADIASDKRAVKDSGEKKKPGFFANLMNLLFGEDEDDEEETPAVVEGAEDLENISDENMEILRAMSGDKLTEPDKAKGKKGKKSKKEKKSEKEKKASKEKEKKPKKEKPPKPKKEKKPKPKGPREKPLPKGPVIVIWVLAISLFALIYLGNNLLTHSNAVSAAEKSFDRGDYVGTYQELAGVKVKGSDAELYEKAKVLAGVQTELQAYYPMMEIRKFDLALDCLVRALGRSDLHMAEAEEYGVTVQMNGIVEEITKQLQDQFNVTAEQARELYAIDDRDEYSLALDAILYELGLKHS